MEQYWCNCYEGTTYPLTSINVKENHNLSYYMDHTDFRSTIFILIDLTIYTLHVWEWYHR